MNENKQGYSDEWQPYTGDYDKFEYDVKLKDGTIITNCYPNAGNFQSLYTYETSSEANVELIRFSTEPRTWLNEGVSANKVNEQEEDWSLTFQELRYKEPLGKYLIWNFYQLRDEYKLIQTKSSIQPKNARDLITKIYNEITGQSTDIRN